VRGVGYTARVFGAGLGALDCLGCRLSAAGVAVRFVGGVRRARNLAEPPELSGGCGGWVLPALPAAAATSWRWGGVAGGRGAGGAAGEHGDPSCAGALWGL